ncbi:MAG: hypothetical protein FKY71_12745 [Spiribacter salinus]|uniref:Uncharacterized protein n=1 Tax=Spiribacter salinus TaxID=1335746 RepID=A0A540VPH4_9GAMM|nr:MAG: hypothetical protein FKY71_12745 [Spiribacter salinus]
MSQEQGLGPTAREMLVWLAGKNPGEGQMNLAEVARWSGVPYGTIYHIHEKPDAGPREKTARAIAEVYYPRKREAEEELKAFLERHAS